MGFERAALSLQLFSLGSHLILELAQLELAQLELAQRLYPGGRDEPSESRSELWYRA